MPQRAYSRNISGQDESIGATFHSSSIIRRWKGNNGSTAGKPDISLRKRSAGVRGMGKLQSGPGHLFERRQQGANSLYNRRVVQPTIELRWDIEIVDGARISRVTGQGALDPRRAGDGQSCYGPAFDHRFVPAVACQCGDVQTRGCEFVDGFLMLGDSSSKAESCEKEDGGMIHPWTGERPLRFSYVEEILHGYWIF